MADTKAKKDKLTYKTDKWPDSGLPTEVYLYVSRGKAHAGRIVISADRVDFTGLNMQPESKDELNHWIEVMLKTWQVKEKQDKRGWKAENDS